MIKKTWVRPKNASNPDCDAIFKKEKQRCYSERARCDGHDITDKRNESTVVSNSITHSENLLFHAYTNPASVQLYRPIEEHSLMSTVHCFALHLLSQSTLDVSRIVDISLTCHIKI